jgi:uncharacterized membrane protein
VVGKTRGRFWEIDLLRGIAIIMMIVFHFLYDLNYFNIYNLDLYSGYLLIYLYGIGTIFILLVGISLTLSYSRVQKTFSKMKIQLKFLKRGLFIFGLGLLITVVSWFYLGEGFIVFGVLHCIGISIILAIPFLKFRYINLSIGIILVILGIILSRFTFNFNWFLWLGFVPSNFYTVDYFPLLPWFGVVLIGLFIGNSLYQNYERKFKLKNLDDLRLIRFLGYLGRHSLIIYFIHQPIILTAFHILTM